MSVHCTSELVLTVNKSFPSFLYDILNDQHLGSTSKKKFHLYRKSLLRPYPSPPSVSGTLMQFLYKYIKIYKKFVFLSGRGSDPLPLADFSANNGSFFTCSFIFNLKRLIIHIYILIRNCSDLM